MDMIAMRKNEGDQCIQFKSGTQAILWYISNCKQNGTHAIKVNSTQLHTDRTLYNTQYTNQICMVADELALS
ncbi:hypothetical protein XELAEV_18028128mg [Xenopus laevis]|uniref:Uncharacterized protein n=1 Tax=Xenopus laevis TaxID=8355 RepID=A0A974CYW0_XENLA|nr:hypothetical protein XELAEV_18028128mg [Xenopus laevis]